MTVATPEDLSLLDEASSTQVAAIEDYYRETIEDYQLWSPAGYMHFGKWDWGLNPLNRQALLERMNDYLFGLLQLEKVAATRIGDFGCGLGAVSRYGARRFPQHAWVGVTISPEQFAWCAQQSVGNRLPLPEQEGDGPPCRLGDNCEFWCADYHQTPFDDGSLGRVFFLESLCHSAELERVLNETRRVLEPGGRVVIIDGLLKKSESQLPRHVRWLMRETCRNWAVPRFHGVHDVVSQAERSGFKLIQTQDIAWSIVPSVMHSPWLIASRAMTLLSRKWFSSPCRPTAWQWRHLRACWLGIFLGLHRRSFGYYSVVLEKA